MYDAGVAEHMCAFPGSFHQNFQGKDHWDPEGEFKEAK